MVKLKVIYALSLGIFTHFLNKYLSYMKVHNYIKIACLKQELYFIILVSMFVTVAHIL